MLKRSYTEKLVQWYIFNNGKNSKGQHLLGKLKYHVYIARCHSDSLSFKVQQILLERIKGSNFNQIAWPC